MQQKIMKMKKNIAYKLLGLAFIVTGMVACDTASQDVEPVISPDGYPKATVTPTATVVAEGDQLEITITTDKIIERSLTFTLNQTGGTADEDDYTVEPAVIAPYTKSAKMIIQTNPDSDFEPNETIIAEIGVFSIAERYMLNPSTVNPFKTTITINNDAPLTVSLSWNADIVIDGETFDAADYIDYDFYLCPETGFDIDDPLANEIGVYDGASSNSPEVIEFMDLEEGSYYIVADLYSNPFVGESDGSVKIPIIATFTREGTTVIDEEVSMNPDEMMADNTPGFTTAPRGTYFYNAVIAKVTYADGKYTITKYDDTTIGPFKSAKTTMTRPLHKR
jgi:hypothetical protein